MFLCLGTFWYEICAVDGAAVGATFLVAMGLKKLGMLSARKIN